MKKSQMINKIAAIIQDTYLWDHISVATAVLEKIEELGMKPPFEKMDPVLYTNSYTWEKEDA